MHRAAVGVGGGWSSLEAAEVCTVCVEVHLHVWVHAGHPACSSLAPGGTLQLLVHFKLILLMLSSFILLSLSVNVFFALHILCVTLTQSTANF